MILSRDSFYVALYGIRTLFDEWISRKPYDLFDQCRLKTGDVSDGRR